MTERYYKLSDFAIDAFNEIYNKKAFAVNIGFAFIGDNKQKKMIKIVKANDHWKFITNKDVLVIINEDLFDSFDEECRLILIEQELDKISINIDNGKVAFTKYDLSTFASLIKKHGIDSISRANQIDVLASQQKEDGTKEPV